MNLEITSGINQWPLPTESEHSLLSFPMRRQFCVSPVTPHCVTSKLCLDFAFGPQIFSGGLHSLRPGSASRIDWIELADFLTEGEGAVPHVGRTSKASRQHEHQSTCPRFLSRTFPIVVPIPSTISCLSPFLFSSQIYTPVSNCCRSCVHTWQSIYRCHTSTYGVFFDSIKFRDLRYLTYKRRYG